LDGRGHVQLHKQEGGKNDTRVASAKGGLTSNFVDSLVDVKLGAADGASIRLINPFRQTHIVVGMTAGEHREAGVVRVGGIGDVEKTVDADGAGVVPKVANHLVKIMLVTHDGGGKCKA
jgi:hypothetical protein